MKKVPSFWWDFDIDNNQIIVESDSDKYPIVAKFEYHYDATEAIEEAQDYIQGLNEGRITPKKLTLR